MAKTKRCVDASTGTLVGWEIFCPGCKTEHVIPAPESYGDKGWQFNGDFEQPTFSPSLLIYGHPAGGGDIPVRQLPRCHSVITAGVIAFCGDSEHELAGKTVELPDVTEEEVL